MAAISSTVAKRFSRTVGRTRLADAGFQQIDLEPTRVYNVDDAREFQVSQNLGH